MARKKGTDSEAFVAPPGYKLVREPKSRRMQLLVRPTIADGLKAAAAEKGVSLNELANMVFEEYLRNN